MIKTYGVIVAKQHVETTGTPEITADDIVRSDRFDSERLSAFSGLEIVSALADRRLPRPPMAESVPFSCLRLLQGGSSFAPLLRLVFSILGAVHGAGQ
jgi:hypothetical protein